jgi:hypothetical protein
MPGKDADKLLDNVIANINEEIVYTYITYGDFKDEKPLEVYIVTKQEHTIKIFRLLPKYSIYNEHLRGLEINDISVFDISSQEVSVFLSKDNISVNNPQFVESFADSPKLIASIVPDKYNHYSVVVLFGIKKSGDSSSYLPANEAKTVETKELYEYQLGKEKIFVVEELRFNEMPKFLDEAILSLWNYYKSNE